MRSKYIFIKWKDVFLDRNKVSFLLSFLGQTFYFSFSFPNKDDNNNKIIIIKNSIQSYTCIPWAPTKLCLTWIIKASCCFYLQPALFPNCFFFLHESIKAKIHHYFVISLHEKKLFFNVRDLLSWLFENLPFQNRPRKPHISPHFVNQLLFPKTIKKCFLET